jgi:hypothetical protein
MIFTKQQYLTIYIFEFLMNQNFTNEICLSKLPIFTSIPCSYPYPTRTRFPSTRTLPVPVSLLPVPDPYPSTSYPYPGSGGGTRPAGCSTLIGRNQQSQELQTLLELKRCQCFRNPRNPSIPSLRILACCSI